MSWNKTHSKVLEEKVKRLKEANSELREQIKLLQQPKSCEGCLHRSFLDKILTNKVTNGFCMENGFFTKVGFCCNRYEAKGAMR